MRDGRIDPRSVSTYPLASRHSKVSVDAFAQPAQPGRSIRDLVDVGLPQTGAGDVFRAVVSAIVESRRRGRTLAWGLGAHVIKCGLSPVIIGLMDAGFVGSVALNGGGSIHDFEIALVGRTSEDVAAGIDDGSFGMAEETGRLMNGAVAAVMSPDGRSEGLGSLLGAKLVEMGAPNLAHSILASGYTRGIPVTCHVAIGADIIHMHPSVDGAALGRATLNDFHRFVGALSDLGAGGTYLNVGSSVILPEVFLKAVAILRNVAEDAFDFTTVNLDMQRHYRPTENVLRRPTRGHGRGLELLGFHELLVPLLAHAVVDEWERVAPSASGKSDE